MNNRRGGYQPPLHFKSVSKADTLTRRKAYFTYHEVVNFTYRRWISPAVRQISLQKQAAHRAACFYTSIPLSPSSIRFSRRETCTWVMLSCFPVSLWVSPFQ